MSTLPTYKELLDAGVHYGHMKRKWNPKMLPNIFMEKKRYPHNRSKQDD